MCNISVCDTVPSLLIYDCVTITVYRCDIIYVPQCKHLTINLYVKTTMNIPPQLIKHVNACKYKLRKH